MRVSNAAVNQNALVAMAAMRGDPFDETRKEWLILMRYLDEVP